MRAVGVARAGARDAGPALDTKSLINRGANSHIAKHLGCHVWGMGGRAGRAPWTRVCVCMRCLWTCPRRAMLPENTAQSGCECNEKKKQCHS
jgi:hypothetical protein